MLDIFDGQRVIVTALSGTLQLKICNKSEYERLVRVSMSENAGAIKRCFISIFGSIGNLPEVEYKRLAGEYIKAVDEIIEICGKFLRVPDCISMHASENNVLLPCHTNGEKLVRDFTGLSFTEIEELQYLTYKYLLSEAVKYNLSGTKQGRELLNEAYDEMFVPFDRKAFLKGW